MRRFLVTTGLVLVLAGCGAEQSERNGRGESGAAANTSEAADAQFESPPVLVAPPSPTPRTRSSVPEVRPEAAPDVAFGYSYNFGIAADRIAGVQQRHARTCEELGTSRCRITGMTYQRSGEDSVEAELKLALDPSLAHRFGVPVAGLALERSVVLGRRGRQEVEIDIAEGNIVNWIAALFREQQRLLR